MSVYRYFLLTHTDALGETAEFDASSDSAAKDHALRIVGRAPGIEVWDAGRLVYRYVAPTASEPVLNQVIESA